MTLKSIFVTAVSLCSIFVSIPKVQAEIERVTITWTALACQDICIRLLHQQFSRIPGVASIALNEGAGQVDLAWKLNVPFSFSPINVAMSLVGLTINDIRVRVHGVLQHTENSVTLVSSGDNTRFNLLNPVVPELHGMAVQFNIAARGLQPALRQQLLEAEAQNRVATIEGPLLMPERSPPLELVVGTMSFSEPR